MDATASKNSEASSSHLYRSQQRTRPQRASWACLSCRVRKVKCDVVISSPCRNCRWDGTQCVVPRTRRSRKVYLGSDNNTSQQQDDRVIYFNYDKGHTSERPDRIEELITDEEVEELVNNTDQPGPETDQDCHIEVGDLGDLLQGPSSITSTQHSAADNQQDGLAGLPGFIKKPSFADPGYTSFLQSQGVFSLPPTTIQCELVNSLVEYIYPRMPLLDLEAFLACISCPGGTKGQLSLVLYSAILFSGSIHLDEEVACKFGYPDKRLMGIVLYKRTQLLFDLETNPDKLAAMQTALLLTCRGVPNDEVKGPWYWVNTAISMGYSIGLHRTSTTTDLPPRKRRHLTRLWWCCHVRDSVLSLGMDRPTRIKEQDFNVPMLEVADLESNVLIKRHSLLQHGQVGPFDKTKELESAELCVKKTRLSVLINQILELQAEAKSQQDEGEPVPANNTHNLKSLHAVNASLRSWKRALPRSCYYRPLVGRNGEFGGRPVDVRRHLLHMIYYTALYTLHKPQSLPSSLHQFTGRNVSQSQEVSKSVVLESTDNITRLAAELNQHNMDCNLPVGAMTAVYPAISMHVLNMKSQSKEVRDRGLVGFRLCIRILNKMQTLYSAAEVTVSFLENVVSNASLTGLGRDAFQFDQQTQADPMAILQALTTQASQEMVEGSTVPSSSWNMNSSKQPEAPDIFTDIDLNINDEFRTGGITGAPLQDMPYGLDLDFHATENDTWMEDNPPGSGMNDNSNDVYAALSSQWLNPILPFNS
ncbi:fungal-specific transcription factor domain-containing protein [Fusarium venenatum]|uniref:fungal-specific transcription factor domain-containing protein n=1 Tax=Fusarium venenatum TaxID=56646 RepID=UPI001DF46187|nr:fungal-specific transcription factor domain-containing protein [Fusarium venenatum]